MDSCILNLFVGKWGKYHFVVILWFLYTHNNVCVSLMKIMNTLQPESLATLL